VAEERVLVIPTSDFHQLGHFQGFSPDVARYFPALLDSNQLSSRPRGEMEIDPSFKQLIPYVLFRFTGRDGTARLFQYTRGGGQGEARLRAKRSVGVGGHISTADEGAGANHDVYLCGMQRELDEEIVIETEFTKQVVGLINDDETPVGQVHLGVVHLFEVAQPNVHPREDDIQRAGFKPIPEILEELDQFETWSQIVVEALFREEA
jgi:predicted NUDIX family phosphoesterase